MKIMNYDTDKIIKGKTYRVNKHIGRVNGDSTANVRESACTRDWKDPMHKGKDPISYRSS